MFGLQTRFAENFRIPRDYAANTDMSTHYRIEEIETEDGAIDERVVALKDVFDENGNVRPQERSKPQDLDAWWARVTEKLSNRSEPDQS